MFGHSYYHSAIRKHIIMFGNMFNDIDVSRFNKAGTAVQTIRVPIAYGPKEKFLIRLRDDANLNKKVAITLPRLSFEVTDMTYDPTRTLNKMQRNTNISKGADKNRSQFTPVPYDINITLSGMFDNNEDAVQVVEQILPFFRPEWTNSVKLVPEMNEYYDIPTVLTGMSIEDAYDADFQSRRAIIYTFTFTVKGYIFGPVSNKGVIKRTILDFTSDLTGGPDSKIKLTPGLLANGNPTSNSSASIAIGGITSNTDYGYAFDKFDYFDGKDRHNHD